ncbi:MAG: glycoside hydrolase family 16 protein [Acidimicrobiaceae bacterium]|nr:glycoside hydrolase family 16 protein [Acidimicrobiaceae bacterium]
MMKARTPVLIVSALIVSQLILSTTTATANNRALIAPLEIGTLHARSATRLSSVSFPVGTSSKSSPSGLAPPPINAMTGFHLTYVNNFNGTKLPVGWDVFTGIPGGAPGGQFGSAHVQVGGGLLRLNTWRDPRYQNRWVTGGLCQCGLTRIYGAYFVRSRVTGGGANEVQLLWPANNTWPPEIDFNENGGNLNATSSTVHWGSRNFAVRRVLAIDMTKWHTWGVVWTHSKIDFVVDGHVWTSITQPAAITRIPMRLDLEQRTICSEHRQCPTTPVSMLVDWIAEYAPG